MRAWGAGPLEEVCRSTAQLCVGGEGVRAPPLGLSLPPVAGWCQASLISLWRGLGAYVCVCVLLLLLCVCV
jgi:hypothetical protein